MLRDGRILVAKTAVPATAGGLILELVRRGTPELGRWRWCGRPDEQLYHLGPLQLHERLAAVVLDDGIDVSL
jgi:hypothetical protein